MKQIYKEKYYKRKADSTLFRGENGRNTKKKKKSVEINFTELPTDPGLRIPILEYDRNICDQVLGEHIFKKVLVNLKSMISHTLKLRKHEDSTQLGLLNIVIGWNIT